MSKKTPRFKSANFRVFLLILVVTTGISVLVKLNKDHNYSIDIPLEFTNLPENKILKTYSTDKVNVSGVASGYEYYKYVFSPKPFEIDLARLGRTKNGLYYHIFDKQNDILRGALTNSRIRKFAPDTVFIDLDDNYETTLPIVSRINLNFDAGYGSLEGPEFSRDSVVVRGAKSDVDTLTRVYTEAKSLDGIKSSLIDSIGLTAPGPDGLEIIPPRIQYKLRVDKFTEGSIAVPLQLINVPSSITAKVFPKKVNVIFNVDFQNYERIKPSDFKVVCDFKEVDSASTSIAPKVVDYPDFIRDLRLKEKTVQYLLVK